MKKRIFGIICILIFNTLTLFGSVKEENFNKNSIKIEKSEEVEVPDYRAFVLGNKRGRIFYSENMREKYPLASVTKIMTLLLTYDALDRGDIKLTDKMTVNEKMVRMGGSKIWMKKGSEISVEDLIKATAIHSANNAAYGLAILVGGTEDNFVRMMNEKARKLGIGDEIEYNTPSGLPPDMTGRGMDRGSALGVYKLALEALHYKEYIKIASQKEAYLSYLGRYKIHNRNKLLGKDGIYGIKTGHLDDWYNIAVASKGDLDAVTVVLGSPNEEKRDEKIISEITRFNDEYKEINFLDRNTPVGTIAIPNGDIKKIEFYVDKDFNYTIKKTDKIKFVIYRKDKLEAPINNGDIIGNYEIKLNNKVIKSGKLIVKDSVEVN